MMPRRGGLTLVAGLAVLVAAAVPGPAAAAEHEVVGLQERLEAFVGLVPGGATAVTIRAGIVTTAATGVLDDGGGTVEPGTPFLLGPLGVPMTTVVVLQLVDEGRIKLDEPVKTYLPDAPVAREATVRDLLDWRAGVPDTYGQMIDLTLRDMGRGWTRRELVDLIDPAAVGVAGDFAPTIGHEIVAEVLVEAVEGTDFGTVLDERINQPLGLTGTADIEGDTPLPPGTAIGWNLDLGLAGDPTVPLAGVRTLDGRVSSATDVATFLAALTGGELLSDELTAVVFDADAVRFGMGFDSHEVALSELGDLGTRYYLSDGDLVSGYSGSLAVSPETGDIVVVLSSNDALPTWRFLHETVSAWAAKE
jgi:D-alanyl-D-alanine carboxypeptidase